MARSINPTSIDELWILLQKRLSNADYAHSYATESHFETDVWKTVVQLSRDIRQDERVTCLTSHATNIERSADAWKNFCREEIGPDVNILGSKNRLDIVFRHLDYGSIGIEIKCLGKSGHAGKLTQGLGQSLLGLANRDRTLLIIHCGSVDVNERKELREVCNKICDSTKLRVVVVP